MQLIVRQYQLIISLIIVVNSYPILSIKYNRTDIMKKRNLIKRNVYPLIQCNLKLSSRHFTATNKNRDKQYINK